MAPADSPRPSPVPASEPCLRVLSFMKPFLPEPSPPQGRRRLAGDNVPLTAAFRAPFMCACVSVGAHVCMCVRARAGVPVWQTPVSVHRYPCAWVHVSASAMRLVLDLRA